MSRFKKGALLFAGSIVVALIVGSLIYIGIDAPQSSTRQTTQAAEEDVWHYQDQGSDETPLTPDAIRAYRAPADQPKQIAIDVISLQTRVREQSINADGSLQLPHSIFDVGWYGASAKPGEVGVTVLVGHSGGATQVTPLSNTAAIKPDDQIRITKGSDAVLTYKVVRQETLLVSDATPARLLESSSTHQLRLLVFTTKHAKSLPSYGYVTMIVAELL